MSETEKKPLFTRTPGICGGRYCANGTRIELALIRDLIAAGYVKQEILADYPLLRPEHVNWAMAHASKAMGETVEATL